MQEEVEAEVKWRRRGRGTGGGGEGGSSAARLASVVEKRSERNETADGIYESYYQMQSWFEGDCCQRNFQNV